MLTTPPYYAYLRHWPRAATTTAPTASSPSSGAATAAVPWRASSKRRRSWRRGGGEGADRHCPGHHPLRHRLGRGAPSGPAAAGAVAAWISHWIRLHYLYPDEITDELIDTIAREPKILKYIDLPIQHCNDRILKLMNRRGGQGLPAGDLPKAPGEDPGPGAAHQPYHRPSRGGRGRL